VATIRPLSEALTSTAVDVPTGEPVLRVDDLALRFGGTRAVDGVSFDVRAGELFAIIGPNGAGKTSIFNCLSGVYRPQEGTISFLDRRLLGRKPDDVARLGIARMFQNIELFDNLTVLDNLMLGRHLHLPYGPVAALFYVGRAREVELANRRIVEDVIDFLEIEPYRKFPVGMLPYGIKKRVELGRALAMEPKLLLLDEPVAGMNVEETEDMARFILDIRAELGVAMIMVEHDMGLVMDLADRVLVVDFGKPIAMGTPAEVQRHPDVVRAYLGEDHKVVGHVDHDQVVLDTGREGGDVRHSTSEEVSS
jgi:branched-chain amino acid transport system ATP-binding protein